MGEDVAKERSKVFEMAIELIKMGQPGQTVDMELVNAHINKMGKQCSRSVAIKENFDLQWLPSGERKSTPEVQVPT